MAIKTISKTIDLSQFIEGRGIDYITVWYQIGGSSTTPPATPTAEGTGYSTAPTAPTRTSPYLWSYEVVHYTVGAPEIGAARVIGMYSQSGSSGYNQATISLYQRSNSTLTSSDVPSNTTYDFTTGQISGSLGNWSTSLPSGTAQCWVTAAVAISQTTSGIPLTWSAPVVFVKNGQDGYTPYIGQNGNWWINGQDTGNSAEGDDGHSPYVDDETGTWWEWDASAVPPAYHDTEIEPQGPQGIQGQGVFKSIVFKRASSQPSTPTGGSYSSPIPSGWSDGIPSGTEQIWMSTRVFTSDGNAPQTAAWTTPNMASDTPDVDFEYSSVATNPGNPTDNPVNWSDAASESSIWMAVRKKSGGTWSSWDISKIKGERGPQGDTPYIGSNGNWWINGVDTGYSAEGDDGHSPYVNTTTNTWWEWNADIGAYHDTEIVPQGEQGIQGYSIVASVSRPNFTDAQWTTYGEVGHVQNWADTSTIRNNCRVGDIFTVVGTSTDGKNAHVLYYRSDTASGNLHGTCISHSIANRGAAGTDGVDGLNQAVVRMYQRAVSAPTGSAARPSSNLTFTFATGTLSANSNGWYREVPATDGNPCWMISAVAVNSDSTDEIATTDWSSPIKFVEDGSDGSTPYIQSGYWYINGTSTGVKAEGEDGTTTNWYYGIGITGDDGEGSVFPYSTITNAVIGDMYLNTDTSAMYQCTLGGGPSVATWVYIGTVSDSIDMSSIVINQRQVRGLQEQLQNKADLVEWINSNEDARAALSKLSDVQDVLGILGWVSEYGTYSATTDFSIDKNKAYYILDSVTGQYNRVTIPSSTYIADMYEQTVEYEYFNTLDAAINPNKTYYTYDRVNDVFVVVVSPQQEDIKTYFERDTIYSYTLTQDSSAVSGKTYYRYDGATNTYIAATPTSTIGPYYELNLSDSIKDYLLSHISITNGQMSVINDNSSYYLTMSPTALEVKNAAGGTIASYGSQIALGNAASGIRNIISSTRISFNTPTGDIAYFGLNNDNIWEMHIDTASVDDMMFFGKFAWITRDNGNLSLKWTGN